MRVFTVHARSGDAGSAPVLVREGFSWGAFLVPTPWFLLHRLWLAAFLHAVAVLVILLAVPAPWTGWALLALQLVVGFEARDLYRHGLARRRYALAALVAAPDEDTAFARIAEQRPDLARAALA